MLGGAWGGGGVMLTFLSLVNMVAATQDVGVMLTFLALVNMVAATQDVGWWVGGVG